MIQINGDLNAAQRQAAEAAQARCGKVPACTANRCRSGSKPCPCPDACHLPERQARDYIGARLGLAVLLASGVLSALSFVHLAGWLGWLK